MAVQTSEILRGFVWEKVTGWQEYLRPEEPVTKKMIIFVLGIKRRVIEQQNDGRIFKTTRETNVKLF